MSGKKDCKFCNKKGLRILVLRYSAVAGENARNLVPDLPPTLGEGVKDIALDYGRYAPRMLREGYLYTLIQREGVKYWEAYVITDDAFLYKFSAERPPQIPIDFTCDQTTCGIDASCIAIDDVDSVDKMYFLFTGSPLTKAKLDEYKAGTDKMQAFDPKAWVNGSHTQNHSLKVSLIEEHVPEWLLYKQCGAALTSPLGKAMEQQLFPAVQSAYAGVPAPAAGKPQPGRLGMLVDKLKRDKGLAFVVHDHIGVTQELNDFRNDAFQPIDDFMGKRTAQGVDNTYRFDIYNAIGQLRTAMEKGLTAKTEDSVEMADRRRRAKVEPIFPDDSHEMRRMKLGANNAYTHPSRAEWEAKHADRVAWFETAREEDEQRQIDLAQQRGQEDWKEYAENLDEKEMNTFIDQFHQLSEQARKDAAARTPQHLAWLKSGRTLKAFDIHDQKDDKSGEALRAQVVCCIFGMEGSPEAEAVLTEWSTATGTTRENLLLRAITRDQTAVKKEADKMLSEVSALVAGMTEMSAMPATSWQKATKGFVSAMKSTDSALDEWMRNQGQAKNYLNPKHIANFEARFFYLISTLTRGVARKGIGGQLEIAVAARANAIMFGFLGDLAQEVEYKTLSNAIDPAKWDDLKQKHKNAEALEKASAARKDAQQKRAYRQAKKAKAALQMAAIDLISDAQLKAKLQLKEGAKRLGWGDLQRQLEASAAEHTNYKAEADALKGKPLPSERVPATASPTNNYHQARIGGVLAGIETIALLGKVKDLKGWDITLLDLLASASSLASVALDMMYVYTKSVRELPKYAAFKGVDLGAEIVRGGLKLASGLCAATAGLLMAFVDWHAIDKTKDPIQRSILWLRLSAVGAAGLGGFLAAYSYAGPALERKAEKAKRPTGRPTRIAKSLAARRVGLLRIVAWLGWVGVAITVVDIGYAGYRWYMDVTALRRWFGKCVFRKDKSEVPYGDARQELKELAKAQNPGQETEEAQSPSMQPAGGG